MEENFSALKDIQCKNPTGCQQNGEKRTTFGSIIMKCGDTITKEILRASLFSLKNIPANSLAPFLQRWMDRKEGQQRKRDNGPIAQQRMVPSGDSGPL